MFFSDQIVFDDKIMFDMDFEESISTNEYGYKTYSPPYRIDQKQIYKINKNKFRGNEIKGDEDLLIAGDSITFGIGVPEESAWPTMAANSLDLNHANLGFPGASTMLIVRSVFSYFKKYKNPKMLFCLFPDPDRMMVPHVEGRLESIENPQKEKFSNIFLDGYTDDVVPKYSKLPHQAEHVIPKNLARWLSLQYIHMLEQYCNSSGIIFVWSTWHPDFGRSILQANTELNIFNNYIDIEIIDNKKYEYNECHAELKDKYPEIFNIGGDVEFGIEHAHPGVHRHAHIAESFEKKIKDDHFRS